MSAASARRWMPSPTRSRERSGDQFDKVSPGVITHSLGRNGTFVTIGIYVDSYRQRITLTAQHSRGDAARGHLTLPNDPGVLRDLIRELVRQCVEAGILHIVGGCVDNPFAGGLRG